MTQPLWAGEPVDPDVGRAADDRRHAEPRPFDRRRPARWPQLRVAVLLAVFAGGAVGGLARYQVTRAWPAAAHGFPWATFTINSGGAFALAVLLVVVVEGLPPTTYVRPVLGTGFCGAWTTFSSVVATTDQLLAHGPARLGVAYLLGSVVAGLGAAALGLVLGRSVSAYRRREGRDGGGR